MTTTTQYSQAEILDLVCEAWNKLQQQQPLVHIMTNTVASNYVANILLAANASPAMIDNAQEASSFAEVASSLSLNIGTPTPEQVKAMLIAAETAHQHEKPWVLDPVGYGKILKWRSEVVDQLLAFKPTVIRGNASEIGALAGQQIESKGVGSTIDGAEVYVQARVLLQHSECIAISGESDYIISKALPTIQVFGGSFLQPRVTATGCALGALISAYTAVSTPVIGTLAAHIHFAIAGQLAYAQQKNVGSFNVAFLDQVFALDESKIRTYASFQLLD